VLTDLPIGAWTVAMVFDALDLVLGRRELARAADASIAIGLVGCNRAGGRSRSGCNRDDGLVRC